MTERERQQCALCLRVQNLHPNTVIRQSATWLAYVNPALGDPGVVVQSVPHVDGLWAMTTEQSHTFGGFAQEVAQALRVGMGAVKVYVVSMGENHEHLHALLLPRFETDPLEGRGLNRITRYLSSGELGDEETLALAASCRAYLNDHDE